MTASSNLGTLLPSSTGNQTSTSASSISATSSATTSSTTTQSGSLQSTSTHSANAVAQATGLMAVAGAAAVGVLGVMAML